MLLFREFKMTNRNPLAQRFTHCGYCEYSINIVMSALFFSTFCILFLSILPWKECSADVSIQKQGCQEWWPSGFTGCPRNALIPSAIPRILFCFLCLGAADVFQTLKRLIILSWWGALFIEGIRRSSHKGKTSCQIFLAGHKLSLKFQPRATLLLGQKKQKKQKKTSFALKLLQIAVSGEASKVLLGTIYRFWLNTSNAIVPVESYWEKSNITPLWIQFYGNATSLVQFYLTWCCCFSVNLLEPWRTKCHPILLWSCAKGFWTVA